ncbi:MAG TPA: PAS domain S-box protein, partial [Myxococcales bacterium]|nr:PAS domain S-box protein [Myxococcales bacterium]
LALLDVRLRGEMDGIQTAAAIRERTDIPVIYLTAYADEDTVRRAMLTGPFGYLVKPFNERELRAAIDIAIYKHATDRLLAEERARRQAAEEFKFLVEGVEDYAIYLLDLAGRVTTWNVGAQRIKGYDAAEIIGRHFSIFYPPEDATAGKPEAELRKALEQGRAEDEGWRVRKDGSRFWANVIITALRDDRGQVRGFAKVTRDLTARREAELDLRRSAARTQAILTGALDCVITIDAGGRVLEWNRAAEETFGYRRDEAIGREMAELIIPEPLRSRHREGLARYLHTGEGPILGKRLELQAMTKERGEIAVELSVVQVTEGASPAFTGFLRDITARKRAEAERERRDQAQQLLDGATLALAGSLEISETIQRAARAALPGLADWCLVDLADENGELGQAAAAHVELEKEGLARRLGRERIPDPGLPRGVHHVFRTGLAEVHAHAEDHASTARLLGTERSSLLHELGVESYLCVPITVRGQTQGVLNLLRSAPGGSYTSGDLWVAQELARRIGLAVDNARLFRAAQDAIRARDEFLQVASHELKTPLTPLQLQLDTVTRALEKTGMQHELLLGKLKMATRQTARLGRLVESLLDMSRITAGKLSLEVEYLDLSDLIRDVAERHRAEAGKTGSGIKVFADRPVGGQWDRLRIEQVVSNLLSNAIKYGAGKPIEVSVREGGEGAVRVEVTDHGIGIEQDVLGRIFGRFERGVSFRNYPGLGLGLFIARQIAEAHGGAVVARSQPGSGSTFTLVLPRQPVQQGASGPEAEGTKR